MVAVPFTTIPAIAEELAPVVAGKVVVDPTNPLTPDYSGLSTAGGPSGAAAPPRGAAAPDDGAAAGERPRPAAPAPFRGTPRWRTRRS